MELGRAAREEALAQAKVALQGFSIKQGMIREGKLMQDERVTQVAGNSHFISCMSKTSCPFYIVSSLLALEMTSGTYSIKHNFLKLISMLNVNFVTNIRYIKILSYIHT